MFVKLVLDEAAAPTGEVDGEEKEAPAPRAAPPGEFVQSDGLCVGRNDLHSLI